MTFCPRCGSRDIKYLKADEVMIRSSRLAALLAGVPYQAGGWLRGRYECQNPGCGWRW